MNLSHPTLQTARISALYVCFTDPPNDIIAYDLLHQSLYGNKTVYLVGTLRNTILAKQVFPGWRVRVYHDNSVPQDTLQQLIEEGAELVNVSGCVHLELSSRNSLASDNSY